MDQHIPSRGEGRVAIHPVAYVTETMMVGTLKGGNVCPLNLDNCVLFPAKGIYSPDPVKPEAAHLCRLAAQWPARTDNQTHPHSCQTPQKMGNLWHHAHVHLLGLSWKLHT